MKGSDYIVTSWKAYNIQIHNFLLYLWPDPLSFCVRQSLAQSESERSVVTVRSYSKRTVETWARVGERKVCCVGLQKVFTATTRQGVRAKLLLQRDKLIKTDQEIVNSKALVYPQLLYGTLTSGRSRCTFWESIRPADSLRPVPRWLLCRTSLGREEEDRGVSQQPFLDSWIKASPLFLAAIEQPWVQVFTSDNVCKWAIVSGELGEPVVVI